MAIVLVVDSNAANRSHVVTLLGYKGHGVMQAPDGAQALRIARRERPSLVVTEVLMPVMDGFELVRELRADPSLAATPVIFSTADLAIDDVAPIANALGVRHIVAAPVDAQELLQATDEVLAHPATGATAAARTLQREHFRALSATLVAKVQELERVKGALAEAEARNNSVDAGAPSGMISLAAADSASPDPARLREIGAFSGPTSDGARWASLVHTYDRDRMLVAGLAQKIQRDEMDRRLRVAERLESLGQLAAGVAHDFNNLLSVIINCAHFVGNGLKEAAASDPHPRWDQLREDNDGIRDAADRATDLTRRLLLFGRRHVAKTEILDVNAVVEDGLKLLTRTLGEHVLLTHDLDRSVGLVMADHGQLEQVLMNLAVNARDAVGDGGSVVIATRPVELDEDAAAMHVGLRPGVYTCLAVTDDGRGMAPETIARAFEPFYTTKRTGQSSGLGLATVYGIVTGLGGNVSIYSEVGHGTSVRAYLPVAVHAELPEAHEPQTTVAGGSGQVVLLSEDDSEIRMIASRLLRENGYSVVAVDRGTEAWALLKDETTRFDLLLTDVIMPEMSGRELAQRAARLRPELPVLFMSGYADGLLAPGGLLDTSLASTSAIDLLEKPFTERTLLEAVSRGIEHARQNPPAERETARGRPG